MTDADAAVLYASADGIATVTLNRPERLNAMNAELLKGAVDALERAREDDDARVVVLTGAGRGFCVGGDLAARGTLGEGGVESRIGVLRAYMRTSQLLREMPKVTIAAINGAVAGAGLSWACAADLRYAAESAKFVTAFANAGLSGDFGGTWTLPRLVGAGKARELYLLSDRFTAQDALGMGLVTGVFDDDAFDDEVRALAERLARAAPLALQSIKQNLNDADQIPFAELLDREAGRHVRSGTTADAAEAGRAFLEKREPHFEGR